jgi:hypothetical protein
MVEPSEFGAAVKSGTRLERSVDENTPLAFTSSPEIAVTAIGVCSIFSANLEAVTTTGFKEDAPA